MNHLQQTDPCQVLVIAVDDNIGDEQKKMMSSVKGALRKSSTDWNMLSPLVGQCREEKSRKYRQTWNRILKGQQIPYPAREVILSHFIR